MGCQERRRFQGTRGLIAQMVGLFIPKACCPYLTVNSHNYFILTLCQNSAITFILTLCQNNFRCGLAAFCDLVLPREEDVSMPKGSLELTQARRDEIINACEKLYQTHSFKEITLKEIASATTFTRTSIYNYFRTKEEIFLALLEREYWQWISSLQAEFQRYQSLTVDQFADIMARTLQDRSQLLKILSMNHYDMETGSRPENLAQFKVAYGQALETVRQALYKYFSNMSDSEKQNFIYTFFPFMFGIYPYSFVTEKQRVAMEKANVNYVFMSIYELTYNCVRRLLNAE